MPKSTTTQARPNAVVGRDGVDEPVGADLVRIVDPDRHPGPDRGPDDEHLVTEVAARHRRPLLGELRHRRGDDRAVDVGEPHSPQAEQVRQRGAELVPGRLAHGGKPPVLGDDVLAVAVDAEVRLGVADVDDEEHGANYSNGGATRRTAWSDPGPARRGCRPAVAPTGRVRSGIELEQGHEHEAARAGLGVRERQPLGAVLEVAEQQHVDVDHPRAVAGAAGGAPHLALHRLAGVEQVLGPELGLDPHAGVEEVRLVEHEPDRLGLIQRRGAPAPARRGPAAPRWPPPGARAGRRCWSRGPGIRWPSRSRGRAAQPWASRHTSTDTSVTGSASGGSGLAALTHTAWASYWSSSRSAIAAHRRSSVL